MPTAITRFWVASRGRPTTPADDTDPHLLGSQSPRPLDAIPCPQPSPTRALDVRRGIDDSDIAEKD